MYEVLEVIMQFYLESHLHLFQNELLRFKSIQSIDAFFKNNSLLVVIINDTDKV